MRDKTELVDDNDSAEVELNGFSQTHDAPLGAVLAEARTAKKFSQTDASNYLRYSVAQINALENDDFAALPQPMITRGFIRNYARYLDLDATPLLESYKARVPDETPYSVRVKSDSYEVMDNKSGQPWLKYILGSILLLLFLLAWMLYVEFLPKNLISETSNVTAESANDAGEVVSEISLPSQASNADIQSEADAANATATVNDTTTNANDVTNNLNSTQPSGVSESNTGVVNPNLPGANLPSTSLPGASLPNTTLPNSALSNPTLSNPSLDPKTLAANQASAANTAGLTAPTTLGTINAANKATAQANIAVKADTWVQATDASGNIVIEKIVPAGATEVITGAKPFNVIIGNAKASSLVYAGKAVDLTPYTTENNVARIKLE